MSEVHDRHLRQLEAELESLQKHSATLGDQIRELEAGRASVDEQANATAELLAHMRGASEE